MIPTTTSMMMAEWSIKWEGNVKKKRIHKTPQGDITL